MSAGRETRQYYQVRAAAVIFGLVTYSSLLWLGWRSVAIVRQAMFPAKLGCGCQVMTVIIPPATLVMAGIGLIAMTLMIGRFGFFFWRHIKRSGQLQNKFSSGSRRIYHRGLKQDVLVTNQSSLAAMTAGLFRPHIYVSAGLLKKLSASEVKAVIQHEQAHQRRHDPLWLAVMDSLSAAWWRLAWLEQWVKASITLRELAADANATAGYRHVDGLSGAILKMANVQPLPGVAAFSPNLDRVEKLLDKNWQPKLPLWRWSYLGGLSVMVLAMSVIFHFTPATAATVPPAATLVCHETRLLCPAAIRKAAGRPVVAPLLFSCDSSGVCASLSNQPTERMSANVFTWSIR